MSGPAPSRLRIGLSAPAAAPASQGASLKRELVEHADAARLLSSDLHVAWAVTCRLNSYKVVTLPPKVVSCYHLSGRSPPTRGRAMSHWGKCTGFDYSNERVGFLNQHIASQRRIAAQGAARPLGFTGTRSVQLGTSIGAPLGTPRALRPLGPLPQPLQRDDLYTRGPLQTALLSRSARSLGQLAPSINEPPYRGQQSCSHLAYCRPTSAFRPAPLGPSIAETARLWTTPRSFASRSSMSGTSVVRSTRLDSARKQAPRTAAACRCARQRFGSRLCTSIRTPCLRTGCMWARVCMSGQRTTGRPVKGCTGGSRGRTPIRDLA